jgi:hypothetical protein
LTAGSRHTASDVFINCPFDDEYAPIFQAIVFAIFACGFRARSARELDDGGQTRIEKLYKLIDECRYGIHDISRTELDAVNGLPRFNMPLELGIFLGAKRYGPKEQKLKKLLVVDIEQYRYQKFISDLAGVDIHEHKGDPKQAIRKTRDWLANVSRRQLPSANKLIGIYDNFCSDLPALAGELDFDPERIPYVDFERIVVNWLLAAPGKA